MCGTCGCNAPLTPPKTNSTISPATQHIALETSLLAANDRIAEQNRRYFVDHGILALNIVSGPGAGKTTLLEATARHYATEHHYATDHHYATAPHDASVPAEPHSPPATQEPPLYVIEGDQQTDHDAQRVRKAGAIAHQINTGHLCHLEAVHIKNALTALAPPPNATLIIENVGNLVCPATFDLGEQLRVVVISTPEGDDKPLKYPDILANADLLIVSKADLSPYVDFDIDACIHHARCIRPGIEALVMSAKTGEGMETWLRWLDSQRQQYRQETAPDSPPSSDLR